MTMYQKGTTLFRNNVVSEEGILIFFFRHGVNKLHNYQVYYSTDTAMDKGSETTYLSNYLTTYQNSRHSIVYSLNYYYKVNRTICYSIV